MPKYKVTLLQKMVEALDVVVEAETPEDAELRARQMAQESSNWQFVCVESGSEQVEGVELVPYTSREN